MNLEVLWLIASPFIVILLVFTLRRIIFTVAALAMQHEERHPAGVAYLPDVMILVSCRDEEAMIPGLCEALSQLRYPPQKLQVALIDDGSADATGRIMEQQAAGRSGWHVLRLSSNVGKARALNIAMDRFPFGEIIYILDADHRLDPKALRNAMRYFFAPRVAAVTGFTKVVNSLASPTAFYSTVESYTNQLVTVRAKDRLGLAPALLGSNCGYRRDLLIAAGGFRNGAFSEDSDLTVTFHRQGFITRFAQEAISNQQVPQTVQGYLKQHIRWGRGLNDVAKVHTAQVLVDSKLGLPIRLELLLFSAGYLDRLALMCAGFLMVITYFFDFRLFSLLLGVISLSLLMPLIQIVALFIKERFDRAMWKRLPWIPIFFMLDIFAAIRAMLDSLLEQPRLWTKTQREELR